MNFEDIEQKIGIDTFLSELAQDLKDKTYHPSPVRRVMIPKRTAVSVRSGYRRSGTG